MYRRMMMEEVGGIKIGKDTPVPNILNMFYALENGTVKTGEFTFDSPLSAGEHFIFDYGLEELNGIMVVDTEWNKTSEQLNNEFTVFSFYMKNRSDGSYLCYALNNRTEDNKGGVNGISINSFFVRATVNIKGTSVYATPQFGGNPDYTPFASKHKYIWVAW